MILVVGGIKGGVGKSTIADNLAVLAARAGQDTLLVDLDAQETSMTWAAARADNPAATAALTTIALTGKQVRAELLRLRDKFAVVIVDAGARDSVSQRAALSVAQMALLPFPPRGPDLWTLEAVAGTVAEVRTINPDLRAVAFVNRADPVGADNDEAEDAFRAHTDHIEAATATDNQGQASTIRVGNRKGIAAAHLAGLAAVEAARPDGKAVAELDALYRYVFDTVSE